LYIVLLGDNLAKNKAQIFSELHSQNIGVQVHYKPTYSFDFYRQKYGDISLPNAELFYAKELSLPCQQKMSAKDAELVLEKLCKIVEKYL
ncbi:MAG: DegT/DnrJ/EryC1/StrS family aminotransferase, partial [Campylobacter sp.]|uniref:DegT/DnrJ/EryC1/StrS family aminotransferase n=1 Tax=Campylobacter sp. TaxID=205 RepID=UPI002A90AB65